MFKILLIKTSKTVKWKFTLYGSREISRDQKFGTTMQFPECLEGTPFTWIGNMVALVVSKEQFKKIDCDVVKN
jgi:hypothetical protein